MKKRTELPNQEKIITLGKKETYKYLGIVEADINKHSEMKENFFKNVSQEKEETTGNQTIPPKSHRMDKHVDCPTS